MSGPLKPYDVEVDGNPTTLMLSDADAKERGLTDAPAKKAAEPANKKRTAPNKS